MIFKFKYDQWLGRNQSFKKKELSTEYCMGFQVLYKYRIQQCNYCICDCVTYIYFHRVLIGLK